MKRHHKGSTVGGISCPLAPKRPAGEMVRLVGGEKILLLKEKQNHFSSSC
jgi:hypothetical protein